MRRRTILAGTASAALTGLAGCTGILGDGGGSGGGGCSPPETNDLEATIPGSGGGFTRFREPIVGPAGEDSPAEEVGIGRFRSDDGSLYVFQVRRYPSAEAARNDRPQASGPNETIGSVAVGNYLFVAAGNAGKDGVRSLLARSPALDEGCVSGSVQFAGS